MVVLGGNMRLRACKSAGMFEVWIDQLLGWTDDEKKEFIIKDNSSFGQWDWDILANAWSTNQLIEWGVDLPVFNMPDLEKIEKPKPQEEKEKCPLCGK